MVLTIIIVYRYLEKYIYLSDLNTGQLIHIITLTSTGVCTNDWHSSLMNSVRIRFVIKCKNIYLKYEILNLSLIFTRYNLHTSIIVNINTKYLTFRYKAFVEASEEIMKYGVLSWLMVIVYIRSLWLIDWTLNIVIVYNPSWSFINNGVNGRDEYYIDYYTQHLHN